MVRGQVARGGPLGFGAPVPVWVRVPHAWMHDCACSVVPVSGTGILEELRGWGSPGGIIRRAETSPGSATSFCPLFCLLPPARSAPSPSLLFHSLLTPRPANTALGVWSPGVRSWPGPSPLARVHQAPTIRGPGLRYLLG